MAEKKPYHRYFWEIFLVILAALLSFVLPRLFKGSEKAEHPGKVADTSSTKARDTDKVPAFPTAPLTKK